MFETFLKIPHKIGEIHDNYDDEDDGDEDISLTYNHVYSQVNAFNYIFMTQLQLASGVFHSQ